MPVLRHPLTGALYTVRDDGNVDVENNGVKGVFRWDGRYVEGDIQHADPHMCLWLAGPQLPAEDAVRRNK